MYKIPKHEFKSSTYIYIYGSRPKTHARLLVSDLHLQIWMCMFCCSGDRPRKGGIRFAKDLNTIIYKRISKRKPDHNLMSRFCWGAKGRERFAKARRFRAFSGTIILDKNIYIYI